MREVYADTAIVVVTYRRMELLQVLFESIVANSAYPGQVFVVDNDKDPAVEAMCTELQAQLRVGVAEAASQAEATEATEATEAASQAGATGQAEAAGATGAERAQRGAPAAADLAAPVIPIVTWVPMPTNTGGSGGFSKGVELAYQAGAEWIWVMDDDVKLLAHALASLRPWMQQAEANNQRVIQCRRLNFDDSLFYWQYHFLYRLGIPNPIAPSKFKEGERFRS
ncbi:MAG: hypothetical protein LBR39_03080, partial [Coriobacteriales bacterium]|nr:hypothetical protein [Coriobacteriales bacterium]